MRNTESWIAVGIIAVLKQQVLYTASGDASNEYKRHRPPRQFRRSGLRLDRHLKPGSTDGLRWWVGRNGEMPLRFGKIGLV